MFAQLKNILENYCDEKSIFHLAWCVLHFFVLLFFIILGLFFSSFVGGGGLSPPIDIHIPIREELADMIYDEWDKNCPDIMEIEIENSDGDVDIYDLA